MTEPFEQSIPASASAPPPAPPTEPVPAANVPVAPVASASAPPADSRPVRRRAWLDVALVVAAIVAVGGIAFAMGRLTAPSTTQVATTGGQFPGGGQGNRNFGGGLLPGAGQGNGVPGNGLFRSAGVAIKGEVVEITSDHLTIKLASGQQVTIPLDSSTAYHQQASASASDVTSGDQVLVQLAPQSTTTSPSASPSPGTRTTRSPGTASDITILAP